MNPNKYPPKTQPEAVEEIPLTVELFKALDQHPVFASGHVMLIMARELGIDVNPEQLNDPGLKMSFINHWAVYQWRQSDRPIFRMSPELATALMNTDMPDEVIDVLPNLPFDGFYLHCPGTFNVYNQETGTHAGEGLLIFRDHVRVDDEPDEDGKVQLHPAIGVMVVGEDKFKGRNEWMRNDALIYSYLVAGRPIVSDARQYEYEGIIEGMKLALNLLFLWNSTETITAQQMQPIAPKSPGKLKKIERQGRSLRKYFYLDLPDGSWGRGKTLGKDYDGPWHETVVCGHFRRYWVREAPDGTQILGKEEKGVQNTPMFCVRKFIKPHKAMRKGEKPERNIREVRA